MFFEKVRDTEKLASVSRYDIVALLISQLWFRSSFALYLAISTVDS